MVYWFCSLDTILLLIFLIRDPCIVVPFLVQLLPMLDIMFRRRLKRNRYPRHVLLTTCTFRPYSQHFVGTYVTLFGAPRYHFATTKTHKLVRKPFPLTMDHTIILIRVRTLTVSAMIMVFVIRMWFISAIVAHAKPVFDAIHVMVIVVIVVTVVIQSG